MFSSGDEMSSSGDEMSSSGGPTQKAEPSLSDFFRPEREVTCALQFAAQLENFKELAQNLPRGQAG